jgi:hypothetical protein
MSFFQIQRALVWSFRCRANLVEMLRGAVSPINPCDLYEDDEAVEIQ